MALHIHSGSCIICGTAPTELNIGSVTCEKCGKTFDKACPDCASKGCPICEGRLAKTHEVFPHSVFHVLSQSLLHALSEQDKDRVLSELDEHTVNLDELKDESGEGLLSRAARAKSAKIAKAICEKLIKRGASPHARSSDRGRTALINMVFYRAFDRGVASLLRSSVNDQDNAGKTALMFAAVGSGLFSSRRGNLGIARDLLKLGADSSIADKGGKTALDHAVKSNDAGKNEEMIEFLKSDARERTLKR
jgi:ankyrin repeat protein